MARTIRVALLVAALAAPAAAGQLIELRDGKLIEAERVDVHETHLVLHIAPGMDNTKKQLRVRMRDIEPLSAARAWATTLDDGDAAGWLELAHFARAGGLFDVADEAYVLAAAARDAAAIELTAFRESRPREESKHHFEVAYEHFGAKRPAAAFEDARAAVKADEKGPYATMARELLDILSDAAKRTADAANIDPRRAAALRRLEVYATRGEARLRASKRLGASRRTSVLASATRLLEDVATRLDALTANDVDGATRERAAALLERVRAQRVDALLLLADLRIQGGAARSAMVTVHQILEIAPDEPLALDLRRRLLDDAEWQSRRERDLLFRGARRQYHAYPYPARDSRTGLGLEPTWDPVRGLGRLPYTRPRFDRDLGDGRVVVVRR